MEERVEGCKVYLTYLDDGGKDSVKVFGGIIVGTPMFSWFEGQCGAIVAKLLPYERLQTWDEFHASDLFAGTGTFEGIPEESRYAALIELLSLPGKFGFAYVYSAIDMRNLQRSPVRSASWMDTAFFMCAREVDEVLRLQGWEIMKKWEERPILGINPAWPLNVLIIDEPGNKEDRNRIRSTFRSMRQTVPRAMRPADGGKGYQHSVGLSCHVDDVFFGSSVDSVGLQVADACNWAMWRRLRDKTEDEFYQALVGKGNVVCAKREPEWSQFRHLFLTHEAS